MEKKDFRVEGSGEMSQVRLIAQILGILQQMKDVGHSETR